MPFWTHQTSCFWASSSFALIIALFSLAGRLFQVEYAMEAVKQGSAAVGVKSKTHVVLASLKRAPQAELSSYQRKVFEIDHHIGIAIAGLTADARVLSKFMRNEALNHKFVYDAPILTNRLVLSVADSMCFLLSPTLSSIFKTMVQSFV